jgi:ABC-type bacteriocin/lantibiotic exporter with double-glycine peptidase domain
VVTAYAEPVKEFWIYTLLRIALFLASLGIVIGVWFMIAGAVPLLWAVVIAFLMSGMGSYFLLNHQREALARRVQTRAEAMTAKVEEMRSKEDAD